MGRQQDAGIAFCEIHLNHGASIFSRLFARVDGIMSQLGRSRRSPGWIGTAAINASCKIAAPRGTNDTLSSQLGNWESPTGLVQSYGQQKFTNFARTHTGPTRSIEFWPPGVASAVSGIASALTLATVRN